LQNLSRTTLIIKSDAISFSAKLGVYTVQGASGMYTVKLNKMTCSCGLKGDQCTDILAVLLANRFDVDVDTPVAEINLAALTKKGKGKGKKSGRKNARPGDVDIIPAPNSAAGEQNGEGIAPSDCQVEKQAEDLQPDEEVWIPSDDIMTTKLLHQHRDILASSLWLDDNIIDASMQIIRHQFDANGLQSCLLAAKPEMFDKEVGEWAQIVNTAPNSGGSHWVLLSTYGLDNTEEEIPIVHVYDSLWSGNTSESMLNTINAIVHAPNSIGKWDVRHMKCDLQPNHSDCGIHASANLVATLSQCNDPRNLRYLESQAMMGHLIECPENEHFTVFPHVSCEEEDEPIHTQSILSTPGPSAKKRKSVSFSQENTVDITDIPEITQPEIPDKTMSTPSPPQKRRKKPRTTKCQKPPNSPNSPVTMTQRGRIIKKKKRKSFSYY
jgi:hypothetical protein